MTNMRDDDEFLDGIIDSILEQQISGGPPDEVRRRILALGDNVPTPALRGRSVLADLSRMAAIAAMLLVSFDIAWWAYIDMATPVSWFRDADTDTWRVMYDNMRIEISRPPAEIRSHG
jgi:hypothetical protein